MAASRRWWQGPPVPVGLVLAHLLTGFAVVFPGRPLCPAALAASGCGLAALLALAATLRLDPGTLPPAGEGDGGDEDATEAAALLPAAGHCRTCGVRRPGLDHHCALLDACVAAGNRGPFLLLVASAAAGAAVLLAAALRGLAAERFFASASPRAGLLAGLAVGYAATALPLGAYALFQLRAEGRWRWRQFARQREKAARPGRC